MTEAVSQGREALSALFPDLQLLADAADAAKHGRLASIQSRVRQIDRADQLKMSPGLFNAPSAKAYSPRLWKSTLKAPTAGM